MAAAFLTMLCRKRPMFPRPETTGEDGFAAGFPDSSGGVGRSMENRPVRGEGLRQIRSFQLQFSFQRSGQTNLQQFPQPGRVFQRAVQQNSATAFEIFQQAGFLGGMFFRNR